MQSHISYLVSRISYLASCISHIAPRFLFLALICLVSLGSVGFVQEAAGEEESRPSFPYVAEITDDNVNIRSGPGTNYYRCGKLNAGDRVKVVASKHSWSHIVPPAGSFSWISKQYVSINPDNPGIGVVTGNAVRVYTGSDLLKPIHSTTVQLHLNKGDKVRLKGEEMGDYYKIAPPTGAYLWVLTQYTKLLGPVGEVPLLVEPQGEPKADIPTSIFVESEKLKEYYALAEQIEAERARPMSQQNYAKVKKALAELAGNREAGKAARYSEFALKQIGRFELALAVGKEVQLQDSQLRHIYERIEKSRATKLAQVPELGGFTAVGQFQTSKIYGQEEELKHYRIIDDSGQTVCYALPEGSASQVDLSKLVGRKVGLVGTVEPHPQTKNALVRFSEITELK